MPYTHGHAAVNTWIISKLSLPAQRDHRLWWFIVIGGMVPDLPLLIFMFIEIPKHGSTVAFDETYHQQPWQDIFGYFHSLPMTLLATICFAGAALPMHAVSVGKTSRDILSLMAASVYSCQWTKRNTHVAEVDPESDERGEMPVTAEDENVTDHPGYSRVFWTQAAMLASASALLHSFADIWLHTDDAHSQLLPFSRVKLHSVISYYDPSEYAWMWQPVEASLTWLACAYMLRNFPPSRKCLRVMVYLVAASYVVLLAVTMIGAILLLV
jgi:hypothetical protein